MGTDTLVWREGWRDWQKAGEVFPQLDAEHTKSLFREIRTQTTSSATTVHTAVIKPRRRSNENRTTIILLLSLAVVILAAILIWVLTLGLGGGGVDARDNARAPADWRCPVQASLLPIVPPPVT